MQEAKSRTDDLNGVIGAINALSEQVMQMRGMFNDEDGSIQDALDAGEDAIEILEGMRATLPL